LWMELDTEIARHRVVEFSWVKAHSGIVHNEIADTLATRGVGIVHSGIDVLPNESLRCVVC
jgi:ribonuclease HI